MSPSNRPVSMGYNGPPAGMMVSSRSTCDDWCPRRRHNERTPSYDNCVTVHAEMNALMFADRRDFDGGTLYVTSAICISCSKAVANSGVRRVVLRVGEADAHRLPDTGISIMQMSRLEVVQWSR